MRWQCRTPEEDMHQRGVGTHSWMMLGGRIRMGMTSSSGWRITLSATAQWGLSEALTVAKLNIF